MAFFHAILELQLFHWKIADFGQVKMAEAVATLALASSILQVIDFGTKVATTAVKIYQASKRSGESSSEVSQLQVVYTKLASTLETLQRDNAPATKDSETDDMHELAKSCATLAKELLGILHDIGLGEVRKKRHAVQVAVNLARKHDDIVSLQARIGEFRSQLTMCLLVSVRQFASQSVSKQDEILEKLGSIRKGPFGSSVVGYVTSGLDASSQEQERQHLEQLLVETIWSQKDTPRDLTSPFKIEATQKVRDQSIRLLLSSLEYPGMQDREDRIADPHESTFKWIFEKSSDEKWISLREWLESNDKLYWVTGVPGSGKSTIMRYISRPVSQDDEEYPRSRSYKFLRQGTGNKRLLIATFYFWNSGLQMQTTQRGLLMTLLRQILEELPELLPLASPTRWENLCLFGRVPNWGDTELRELLLLCVKNLEHFDATVAFFVDGLDEFQGEPKELVSMFQEMRNLPYNKLCVASRPWNEFKDAFGKEPSLMVEQLTRDDIKHFVAARFDSDLRFTQLPSQELDQLIEDIVTKASGVFLWVSLVVSSLISGMGNGDRIIDLRKRFDLLPPDLSKLYKKMIQSLDPFYLEHAAQLFGLVGASREPMNLLLASFVDEEDPQFALRMEFKIMSDQEIDIRMDAMRRRINSRSRGLLEVKGGKSTPQGISYNASSYKDVTVQYLHRTVKDFVESPDVQQTLRDALKTPFDPHLRFLAGRLAYLKSMRTSILPRGGAGIHRTEKYVIECFSIAREVQAQSNVPMIHLLDNLLKVCSSITTTPYLREHCEGGRFGGTFLSLAAACNVVEYVRAKATSPCLIQRTDQAQWPLLMDAMFGHVGGGFLSDFAESDPTVSIRERYRATIEVLLEKGADPKYEMIHKTWAGQDNSSSPLVEAAKFHMTDGDGLSLVAVQLLSRHNTFDTSTLDSIILGYFSLKRIIYPNKKRLADFLARRAIKKVIGKALEDTAKGTPPDFEKIWRQLISTHKLTTASDYDREAWLEAKKNRREWRARRRLLHVAPAPQSNSRRLPSTRANRPSYYGQIGTVRDTKNVEVSRR